jgi:uncharacterized membrane protein
MNERPVPDALETTLGRVLGTGVMLSTLALAAGLVSALALGESPLTTTLLTAGVVLLISTPIARVVISCLTYLRRRDWTFVVLTLIVLGELLASIVAAIRGRT